MSEEEKQSILGGWPAEVVEIVGRTGMTGTPEAGWEAVIGLELHVQLDTESKIFSGASTAYGAEPNRQADMLAPGRRRVAAMPPPCRRQAAARPPPGTMV